MIDVDAADTEFKKLSNAEPRDARIIFPHESIYRQIHAVLEKRLCGEIDELRDFFRRKLAQEEPVEEDFTEALEGWCSEFNKSVAAMEAPLEEKNYGSHLRFIPKQIQPGKIGGRAVLANGRHESTAAPSQGQELFMLAREVKKLEGWKKQVIRRIIERKERLERETEELKREAREIRTELTAFPKDTSKLKPSVQAQHQKLTRKKAALHGDITEKLLSLAGRKEALRRLEKIDLVSAANENKEKTAQKAMELYVNQLKTAIRASGNPLPQLESIRDLYSVDVNVKGPAVKNGAQADTPKMKTEPKTKLAPKRIDSRFRGNDIKKRPKTRWRMMFVAVAGLFMEPDGILRPCLPAGRQAQDDTSTVQDDNLTSHSNGPVGLSPSKPQDGETPQTNPKAQKKLKQKLAELKWEIERHIELNPINIWCDFATNAKTGGVSIDPWMMPNIDIMMPEFATNQLQITVYGEPREGLTPDEKNKRTAFASFPKIDKISFPIENWEGFFTSRRPYIKVEFIDSDGITHVVFEKAVDVNFIYPSPLAQDHIRRILEKEGIPIGIIGR